MQYYEPAGSPYPCAQSVNFTCEPQEVDAGYFQGHWTAYCYDPDGMVVELWQLPTPVGVEPEPPGKPTTVR